MKRGVILEIGNQYITLLTPEGEFLRSRKGKEHYEIGEEVDFFPVNEYVPTKKSYFRLNKWRTGIASAVAAALLFFSIFNLYDGNEVYAYMTIDINPSIEAGVDKKLRVVSLEAFNSEGEEVVNNLEEWMNEPIDSVTQAIIQESKDSGYYKEGAEVLLTTVIVEEEDAPLAEELNENVQSIVESSKEEEVVITALNSTKEDREHALEQGISTGKYVKETLTAREKDLEKQEKKEMKAAEKGLNNGNGQGKGSDHKNDNQGKNNGNDKQDKLFDKKGDPNNPAGIDKDKPKMNDKQSNKGKSNQEDKNGPPEAVQKGKEKQQDKKKQENNNKNRNNKHENNHHNK
ncbi:anti-sigma factor domain-containing protein [Bacillus suaedaesalsae]|uniref:Anti-sigma factor domain-containing protein n=1 Tax=Bacillus suaedaesalsae TaxID=2810349 RepID=A0ABS2DKX1_9BACI|nr:anti-sigma factor domain-containing protein [Bacillus suaedaesalsae]MBM6618118.1 anti-sigma factor domain-containing protein [Bacillus suaedaesalsae]